jgi:hypothetical protein
MTTEEVNAVLFAVAKELQDKCEESGIEIALRGGLAVHILKASVGKEPVEWKHKDIDFVLPTKQLSSFIGLLKSRGYVKSPLSSKDGRHFVYQNQVKEQKISINFAGMPSVKSILIEYTGQNYRVLPPPILLENAREKWITLNKNPKVKRSVDFLEEFVTLQK